MSTLITSAEDLKERENYREFLDFGENSGRELLDILGDYAFPDTKMIQCGIQGCRTPHMRGFLVLTTDGLETNIGNVCGKKHLGESFKVKKAIFFQKQNEIRNVSLILDLKEKIELIRPKLEDLHVRANTVVKLKMICNKAHVQLARLIVERAKLDKPALTKPVPMSKAEAKGLHFHEAKEDERGEVEPFEKWFDRRRPTKVVQVASLEGLLFWRFDLHQIFRQDVLNKVSELNRLDDQSLSESSSLFKREFARWGQGLDHKLATIEEVVKAGERFFALVNIESLILLEPELDKSSRPLLRYALESIKKTIKAG
ncbi:hypothetical protein AO392_18735 [Pseudomonas putida]|uniref:hypothetical protein n=1 Tax=Pseudomonas putida TaxID=303 RepID=UPI000731214E|nr:hypothetical protein [Pseudomonas putida]KTC22481.1 hypothetical protein AO392_18735 [Pseudomonas putida]